MNIGTHFDYNNHIALISSHTKIGTPHEKVLLFKRSANSAFLNVTANFHQRLAPIVSKQSKWDQAKI